MKLFTDLEVALPMADMSMGMFTSGESLVEESDLEYVYSLGLVLRVCCSLYLSYGRSVN